MRSFDYGFLKDTLLPGRLVGVTGRAYGLKTAAVQQREAHPRLFSGLERIARVQSVKSSNALEGIVTTDERLASIVNDSAAPLNHDEAEIAGYRDALALVHENYRDLDFRQADIRHLHRVMLAASGAEDAGEYKSEDNLILQVDGSGRRHIRFRPVAASDTAEAMEQLELAYVAARGEAGIDPLLLIPAVILDFLCVHPFRDGNGRLSRLLTLLLLRKNGFDVGKYVSLEAQINRDKEAYYAALAESSVDWDTGRNSYLAVIEHFLVTVERCYLELERRFPAAGSPAKTTKAARVAQAVRRSPVPISKAELAELLPDVSITTIEAALGRLVKTRAIRKIGRGRATRYHHN